MTTEVNYGVYYEILPSLTLQVDKGPLNFPRRLQISFDCKRLEVPAMLDLLSETTPSKNLCQVVTLHLFAFLILCSWLPTLCKSFFYQEKKFPF